MAERPSIADLNLRSHVDGRLLGMRVTRYSWWTHARELADFLLPRRYKWLITPNQMSRGSPINQHILDSTGTLAARNLASGMMMGCSNPTKPWFKLKINRIDSTQTSPISLWLAECERLLTLIFQESNFYPAMATFYFDLVVFGTGVVIIYEDFDKVIHCFNPCFGEYYVDCDGRLRPTILYREFTYTVAQAVNEFGYENCSSTLQRLWDAGQRNGAELTRELIIAHAIEPNEDPSVSGVPASFAFYEVYWEWGGSTSPQGGSAYPAGFLRKRGFHEQPQMTVRWDLVSNDPYGRSPGMDALPDVKQLQQEVKRKAQGIDKGVNPPMLADIQLKNQPASLLPGGVTYISGLMQGHHPGFASVYGNWRPDIKAMSEDLMEIRDRIKRIFFNDLFQTISQYQTRSNVTAVEIDARRAEGLLMLGPVLERVNFEGLDIAIDRVFNIAHRAGILPPAPAEIAGAAIDIEYVSMLATAQAATAASGIERLLAMVGNVAAIDPAAADNVDIDYGLDKMSSLLNNDPKLIRSPAQLDSIRNKREQQQAAAQNAELAEKYAKGAQVMSDIDVGGGQNALQRMTGI